ncbi:alpha/beta fold hydrolase, partial [Streptomyces himastatinicus]|uniref:alpha/beta fold hydrolase n=1 Tax=Streptomyces himastatinicus TaxID=998084 RepID=UPI0001B4BAB2
MTQVKSITANGIEFGYLEAGPAGAPLALCLHGFPDTAHSWRHLLPALADAGYHAVAPFMRGYAPTGIPEDGAYQAGAIASDANALHEAFGADGDAVLIGHDWGAIAAYGATAHAPERWRRAVTMSVPPLSGVLADFFNYDYGQFKRSFYIFLFQTPLAEAGAAAHDMALIDGLWRDWSPGYHDSARDIAHVKESLKDPAHLAAAIGYYKALFDPTRQVPRYA